MSLIFLTGDYKQDIMTLTDQLNGNLDARNIQPDIIVPVQTGKTGTYLKTNGFLASWSAGNGNVLFDHYADVGNVTTGETDLFSDTTAASALTNNGEKIEARYAGIFVTHATATREIKVYFGGTLIFDSGAVTIAAGADAWDIQVLVVRESSTVVRTIVSFLNTGATVTSLTTYTRITGLTLTGTNILKITGQAAGVGAATNDIVAKLGTVSFRPAA